MAQIDVLAMNCRGSALTLVLIVIGLLSSVTGIFLFRHQNALASTVRTEEKMNQYRLTEDIHTVLGMSDQCRRNISFNFDHGTDLQSTKLSLSKISFFDSDGIEIRSLISTTDVAKSIELSNFKKLDSTENSLTGDLTIEFYDPIKDQPPRFRFPAKPLVFTDVQISAPANAGGTTHKLSGCNTKINTQNNFYAGNQIGLKKSAHKSWPSMNSGSKDNYHKSFTLDSDGKPRFVQASGRCTIKGEDSTLGVNLAVKRGSDTLFKFSLCYLKSVSGSDTAEVQAGQFVELPADADVVEIQIEAQSKDNDSHIEGQSDLVFMK